MTDGGEEVARGKRRVRQHEMEESSEVRLRQLLPDAWVVHDYAPDYGIDKVIEVFEPLATSPTISETHGQHLMVQLKSADSCTPTTVNVHARSNVAKPPTLFRIDGESAEISVFRFQIDTDTLATAARMGAAAPVVLILVCLDTGRAFFVCLNDLIDKVLDPEEPGWRMQANKTISVPERNEITDDPRGIGLTNLRFYSKREKLHGFFNLVAYQFHEMQCLRGLPAPRATITGWAHQLLGLEVWDTPEWAIMLDYHAELQSFRTKVEDHNNPDLAVFDAAFHLWCRLDALSSTFEELCREWCLPTLLAQYLSYPD